MTGPEPLRILLLEDSEADAELQIAELRRTGLEFTVRVVKTRDAFVDALDNFAPSVILSDHAMPNFSGLAALEIARTAAGDVPFIFVSGTLGEERAIESLRSGATDYVLKDHIARLGPVVRRALDEARERGDLRRAQEALRASEERYALAAAGTNDGIWDWDVVSGVLYLSPRWRTLVGLETDDKAERPEDWFSRVHPDDLETLISQVELHIAGMSSHLESEHRLRHRDGRWVWVLCRALAVRDAEGKAVRMAGSMADISALKHAEEKLVQNAVMDSLTGLPNRLRFLDRLEQRLSIARRYPDNPFGVIALDLDGFGQVNQSFGLEIGDRLLQRVARRIELRLRPDDTLARLGADEYAILLENADEPTEALERALEIQAAIAEPSPLGTNEVGTTASLGIALSATGFEHAQDMLQAAESAMFRAKGMGRARATLFDPVVQERALDRFALQRDLTRGLDRGEFVPFYQPIISLRAGEVVGCEALARWNHLERGLVSPADFIPIAEESGAIVVLGEKIMRAACTEGRRWLAQYGPSFSMSINLSATQFREKGLAALVSRVLHETGFPAQSLILELTESAVMEDPEEAAVILRELRRLDVRLSLDDFGTGYSSLAYLRRFPFASLKLDRSFVRDLPHDRDADAITTTVIAMGHNLRLSVVAEGIENAKQYHYLQGLGCDEGQGFLFGKPMPVTDFDLFLESHTNGASFATAAPG